MDSTGRNIGSSPKMLRKAPPWVTKSSSISLTTVKSPSLTIEEPAAFWCTSTSLFRSGPFSTCTEAHEPCGCWEPSSAPTTTTTTTSSSNCNNSNYNCSNNSNNSSSSNRFTRSFRSAFRFCLRVRRRTWRHWRWPKALRPEVSAPSATRGASIACSTRAVTCASATSVHCSCTAELALPDRVSVPFAAPPFVMSSAPTAPSCPPPPPPPPLALVNYNTIWISLTPVG